jgi:hypothetical protein
MSAGVVATRECLVPAHEPMLLRPTTSLGQMMLGFPLRSRCRCNVAADASYPRGMRGINPTVPRAGSRRKRGVRLTVDFAEPLTREEQHQAKTPLPVQLRSTPERPGPVAQLVFKTSTAS